jgi:hypothetical protein
MPWYWTMSEGPPVAAFGVVLLVLLKSMAGADASAR